MKPFLLLTLSLSLAASARAQQETVSPPSQEPERSVPVTPGAAKSFQIPTIAEKRLSSGLTLAVMEMHRLALVSIKLVLPLGGSALDPQGKSGLASLVSSLLTEGAGKMTGQRFAEALDDIGASLGVSVAKDAMTVTIFAAKENIDKALGLAAAAIRKPALPQVDFDRIKTEMRAGLQQEKGSPGNLAEKRLNLRLYGDHPYGRAMDEDSLNALTLNDARTFAAQRLRPEGAIAVAGGDITLPEFESLMTKHFGNWRPAAATKPSDIPNVVAAAEANGGLVIDLIDMPGSQQSALRAGVIGVDRNNQDFMALAVMNYLLGQAPIMSRLSKNLRETHGWTYNAHSSLNAAKKGGDLSITTDVQTDATTLAIGEILNELRRLRDEEVPAAELEAVKRLMAGLFVQRQQTVQALSAQVASIELNGLSQDELITYRDRVMAVTPAQLQAVARKYVHPETLKIVVSGDAAKVQKDLETLGTVRVFDVDGVPKSPAQS